MKTFYSILYAVIRPETDEKIAVGLVLSDGNNSIFEASLNKLGTVRSLLGTDSVKFIKNYITAVKKTVKDSLKGINQQSIFEYTKSRHAVINESYFNYLSIYSTNLVWFSKPLQIDIQVNEQNYNTLFIKLIDEHRNDRCNKEKNLIPDRVYLPQKPDKAIKSGYEHRKTSWKH